MMNDKNLKHVGTLSALAAALLLGGCMSFIPAYERPAAPVAPAYAAELLPAGASGTAAAADIEWQRFFTDARLRRLIEISLANNRDLRIAVLNIEAARAAYQVKRADELPSVGAGFTANRAAGATGGLVNTYAVGLQVTSYEVDFFGRVRSLSQAALSQYRARRCRSRWSRRSPTPMWRCCPTTSCCASRATR
jgi:multidrug efflux system outer membrane protein